MAEKQAATVQKPHRGWSVAEARGFEPRMGANPNRISSPFAPPKVKD